MSDSTGAPQSEDGGIFAAFHALTLKGLEQSILDAQARYERGEAQADPAAAGGAPMDMGGGSALPPADGAPPDFGGPVDLPDAGAPDPAAAPVDMGGDSALPPV